MQAAHANVAPVVFMPVEIILQAAELPLNIFLQHKSSAIDHKRVIRFNTGDQSLDAVLEAASASQNDTIGVYYVAHKVHEVPNPNKLELPDCITQGYSERISPLLYPIEEPDLVRFHIDHIIKKGRALGNSAINENSVRRARYFMVESLRRNTAALFGEAEDLVRKIDEYENGLIKSGQSRLLVAYEVVEEHSAPLKHPYNIQVYFVPAGNQTYVMDYIGNKLENSGILFNGQVISTLYYRMNNWFRTGSLARRLAPANQPGPHATAQSL